MARNIDEQLARKIPASVAARIKHISIESEPVPMDISLLMGILQESQDQLKKAIDAGFITLKFDRNITLREFLRFLISYDL